MTNEVKKKNSLIIFLDFDGVLHPFFPRGDLSDEENKYFSYVKNFEDAIVSILDYFDVKIVISSTWRINKPIDELKTNFSEKISNLIIDITPEINDEVLYDGLREMEAKQWLRQNNTYKNWIALDDHPFLWTTKDNLVICNDGFRKDEAIDLLKKVYNLKALS